MQNSLVKNFLDTNNKDKLFETKEPQKDFKFNAKVADVFNDILKV